MIPAHVLHEAVLAIARAKPIEPIDPVRTEPADDGVYVFGYAHISDEEISDYLSANYLPYRLQKMQEVAQV